VSWNSTVVVSAADVLDSSNGDPMNQDRGNRTDNGALCPGQTGVAPPEKRVSQRPHRYIMNVIVRPAMVDVRSAGQRLFPRCARGHLVVLQKETNFTESVVSSPANSEPCADMMTSTFGENEIRLANQVGRQDRAKNQNQFRRKALVINNSRIRNPLK
jgi:hypothetical protein